MNASKIPTESDEGRLGGVRTTGPGLLQRSPYRGSWAVILGGSSGFGLASAKALAQKGMNLCIVHRDRRGSMERIESEFETLRSLGIELVTHNANGLKSEIISEVLSDLTHRCEATEGRVKLFLHSLAFGSLKLLCPLKSVPQEGAKKLAQKLGLSEEALAALVDEVTAEGEYPELESLSSGPQYNSEVLLSDEEVLDTIHAMGVSLLSWTRELFARRLFEDDARVVGLTSEGNEIAWLGYAAVSAAKTTLEALCRSIAKEFGPHGVRANVVQPGVTDTPALRLIPGSQRLKARAVSRNPLGRLTTVEDVANVVEFLASPEARWINGSIIRVDGGEHISS